MNKYLRVQWSVGADKDKFISHFLMGVISYLCWDWSLAMLVQEARGNKTPGATQPWL